MPRLVNELLNAARPANQRTVITSLAQGAEHPTAADLQAVRISRCRRPDRAQRSSGVSRVRVGLTAAERLLNGVSLLEITRRVVCLRREQLLAGLAIPDGLSQCSKRVFARSHVDEEPVFRLVHHKAIGHRG